MDHVGIAVADGARSRAFYSAALEPLGIELIMEFEGWAGYGPTGTPPAGLQRKPSFWLHPTKGAITPIHVAFRARDRESVRAFYAVAMLEGGRDNGAPGLRAQYHPTYYAAFVFDPDGHNVEAVCHAAS